VSARVATLMQGRLGGEEISRVLTPDAASAFLAPSGHNPLVSRTTTICGTYAQTLGDKLASKRKKIALSPVN
jgi:hypothetical protein